MKRIVEYFVDNSFIVNTLSLGMIVIGLISLSSMQRDLIPQWKDKRISITAALPGATPYQVEQYLTSPIEDAVKSLSGVDKLVSTSSPSSMSINLRLKDSIEEDEIDDLYEKVNSIVINLERDLPTETENLSVVNHKVSSFWFTTLSVLNFNESSNIHQKWLSDTQKSLAKIRGVVEVSNWTSKPQIYIKFDQKKLSRYQVQINDLMANVVRRFAFLPLGTITKNGNEVSVEISNDVDGIRDIEDTIVNANASGKILRVKDIATVEYKIAEKETISFTNGKSAAVLVLFKDVDSDIITMKQDLEKMLIKLNKDSPKELEVLLTGDGPSFIEKQLRVLNSNGILGGILVVFILFIFFGLKSSLMTSFGLPLSYLATFTVLKLLGINIDLISVVGMLLIVGILVDDAIIVSELYMQKLEGGATPRQAAIDSSLETMLPIFGTVLTTVIAFAPILFTKSGLSDILMAIPWVVIAALTMSLLECFFILPNHLAHFVKTPIKEKKFSLFNKISRLYGVALSGALKWRYIVLVVLVGSLIGTFLVTKEKVPFKFNLRIGSERIKLDVVLKKSNSLKHTEEILKPLHEFLETIDKSKYAYVSTNIGRNWYNGVEQRGYRYAGIDLRFSEADENAVENREEIMKLLEKNLETFKTDEFEVLSLKKAKDGYDDKKENTFKLSTYMEGKVRDEAVIAEVKKTFSTIKGIKDVYIDPDLISTTWIFEPNKSALYGYGITPIDLSSKVQGFIRKTHIKEYRHNGEVVNIYGYIQDGKSLTFEQLSELSVNIGNGQIVKLRDLGLWKKVKSLKKIQHEGAKRALNFDLTYDEKVLKKEKISEIVKDKFPEIKKRLAGISFALEDADLQESKNSKAMMTMMITCVFLILFVLALILKSFVQPLIIGMAIPFGLIGVVWAFYFHSLPIDIMGMVGIMGMAGVVVNDSLIMVTTINNKKKLWFLTRDDIHSGAVSRFRAIILTSITTLGGVFPMAYGLGGDSGFTKSLALSMGWGLLFATGLTLFALPALLEIQRDSWRVLAKIKFLKNYFAEDNFEEVLLKNSSAEVIPSYQVEEKSLSENSLQ
ncbi:efflux RND transporter permease subunit [Halobacteriovorax sp. JY17]|uniref:efflux RND transporter permease subunit n=1 Tax=Halobacteriovorax sp. JY17 TaxID=2014617 RepID=UPI000C4039F4|nr:efflux RND transporter permease subunit [Halobacteriovorax sp. JY17]PIK15907.1 MAG: hypothetical protein CES88_04050 [Halobacteriovorax sp. JY17]